MRYYVIPETFFKSIAEKGKLYSRLWFYWLSEHVDEIFDNDFIEKQEKQYNSVGEIREIYNHGVQLLQQEFRFIEKKSQESKPVNKQVRQVAEKVILYLNEKAGSTFSTKGTNIELIAARISEGFTISDFKLVVDKKVIDWKGTDQQKYLRPITLFSKTKFENYLNGLNDAGNPKNNFGKFADSVEKAKQLIGLRK